MKKNTPQQEQLEDKYFWKYRTVGALKQKRYQITENQLQFILEKQINKKNTQFPSLNSYEEKLAFIKPGNILTFKTKLPGFPMCQIAIAKIQRSKSGKIKLTNPFGTETPWFDSEAELIQALDWNWMKQNIITKNEIE